MEAKLLGPPKPALVEQWVCQDILKWSSSILGFQCLPGVPLVFCCQLYPFVLSGFPQGYPQLRMKGKTQCSLPEPHRWPQTLCTLLCMSKRSNLKTKAAEAQISSKHNCSCSLYSTIQWHLLKQDCHSHQPGAGWPPALLSTGVFPGTLPQVFCTMS